STESGSPVSAIIGTPSRFSWLTSPNSSSEAPLFDSRSATSSWPTMPRSPCRESTGWRNDAGVPVDVKVAATLRAINPDLPSPETMRRPFASARRRTARANAGPRRSPTRRIASASRASTRRPRSASSLGSMRDIATLQEVLREQALPLAPGLEDQLGHFADGVLDVKALEFDRVIALHPDVDAVVGQDAVDVKADELQAPGDGSVEHGHLRARARGAA